MGLSQYNAKQTRTMRITALFMVFIVLMFLLISTFFIAHEADHDCSGEDCPICALIHISEDNLRHIGSGAPAMPAEVLLILLIMVMQICLDDCIIIPTPVSRKTRLDC